MKALKAFSKPFETSQRSVKLKTEVNFILIQISKMHGAGRVSLFVPRFNINTFRTNVFSLKMFKKKKNWSKFFDFTLQYQQNCFIAFNPFQPSAPLYIETSSLICRANQVSGFCVKCITKLKWIIRPSLKFLRPWKVLWKKTGPNSYFWIIRLWKPGSEEVKTESIT